MIQPPSHTAAPFAANAPAPLAGRGGSRSRASRIAPLSIDTARDFVYLQNMTPSRRDADPRPSRSAPRRCGTRRKARHAAPGRFRRTRSGPRESLSSSPFALIRSRRFTAAADLDLDPSAVSSGPNSGDIDATDGTLAEGYEGWQLGWNELSHATVANRLVCARRANDVSDAVARWFSLRVLFRAVWPMATLTQTESVLRGRSLERSRPSVFVSSFRKHLPLQCRQ